MQSNNVGDNEHIPKHMNDSDWEIVYTNNRNDHMVDTHSSLKHSMYQ